MRKKIKIVTPIAVMFFFVLFVGCSNPAPLSTIEILNEPKTTIFATGSAFNVDGIKIVSVCNDGSTLDITNKVNYSINGKTYANWASLPKEAGDYAVTVSYTKKNITKTVDFAIKISTPVDIDNIRKEIWYLTKDSPIVVTGFLNTENLKKIAELIKGSEHKITLDLSKTVGLTTLASNFHTSYGEGVFSKNENLVGITLPNTLTTISDCAFYDCKNLRNIKIPNSVTSIGDSAFWGCENLMNIRLPDSATEIKNSAFRGCESIKDIIIPNSVKKIGTSVFSGCGNVQSISVSKGNTVYDSRNSCNAIIETETNTLLTGCSSTIIPDTVIKIGESAFWGCKNLKKIAIPSGVKIIEENPFVDCVNLESIMVSDNNSEYDNRNFCNAIIKTSTNSLIAGCYRTKIPYGVKTIGMDAFRGCEKLVEIKIPDSVLHIENSAFSSSGLKKISIPNSVITIGVHSFWLCTDLETVKIPSSVKSIGVNAFELCFKLKSVIFFETDGWYATENLSAQNGINLDLHYSSTAAEYLRKTYSKYYWHRK